MVAERVADGRPDPASVCCNGHRRTYKNLYRDTSGRVRCLPCMRETWRRYYRTHPPAPKGPRPRGQSSVCRNGHARTPENGYTDPRGKIVCRECRKENKRAHYARRKAQRQRGASLLPITRLRPSQAPLTGFDAVAAAQVAQARQIAATGRPTFRDVIRAGEAARRERRIRERGRVLGKPTPEQIRAATADAFALDLADLDGPSRERDVIRLRQLACYLIRQECAGVSFEQIGRLFGRDHTTVMFGVERIARLVAAGDEGVLQGLDLIRESLLGEAAG